MIFGIILFILQVNIMPSEIPQDLSFIGKNTKGFAEFIDNKDSTTYIYIPAGEFTMGNDDKYNDGDENPPHKVYLDGYFISKYEITNKQYKRFCDATGHKYPKDPHFKGMENYFENYPDYPVVNINYYDALNYCKWANADLPTEAQWEKAAKGIDNRRYPWGEHSPYYEKEYYANYDPGGYDQDGYFFTCPVNAFPQGISFYGLYNMGGNVWEWCKDYYEKFYYKTAPYKNPFNDRKGSTDMVMRGGSFYAFAWNMRCSDRSMSPPTDPWYSIGFRIIKKQGE